MNNILLLLPPAAYTGVKHTHVLVVTLFLLLYLYKGFLLLSGRHEQLDRFSQKFRVPEMIISFLFLITGGLMLIDGVVTTMLIAKIAIVFASIPLAVIGFKRKNKALGLLSVVLLIAAYGLAEMDKVGAKRAADVPAGADSMVQGKAIYEANCIACHGPDGKSMLAGAKDLTVTQLKDEDIMTLLHTGKKRHAGL
ncbi:MAG: cytochrome c [Bacteroidia bacterium]